MGRRPTKYFNLPVRMRARQKPGGVYYYYDCGGKPRREIPLGRDYTEAVRKWAELEGGDSQNVVRNISLKAVVDRYRRDVLPTKATRTIKDNLVELENLLDFFGSDFPINAIEAIHVRQFLNHRRTAPVRANREKALLSHVFNKAREWGITNNANPCAGIKGFSETGRRVYIEDNIFDAVYGVGCQPIKDAMDLAYLTAQRLSDTLKMSATDIKDGFLHVDQGKTNKKLRIAVEGRLAQVVKRIEEQKEHFKVRTLQLVCNESGMPMRLKALQSRFKKARQAAMLANPKLATEIAKFQFRDLRAKAGTDKLDSSQNIVEAQRQLGHSTVAMTEHYIRNRLGDRVTPTK